MGKLTAQVRISECFPTAKPGTETSEFVALSLTFWFSQAAARGLRRERVLLELHAARHVVLERTHGTTSAPCPTSIEVLSHQLRLS